MIARHRRRKQKRRAAHAARKDNRSRGILNQPGIAARSAGGAPDVEAVREAIRKVEKQGI